MKKAVALLLVLMLAFCSTTVLANEGEQIESTENLEENDVVQVPGANTEFETPEAPQTPTEPETPAEPEGTDGQEVETGNPEEEPVEDKIENPITTVVPKNEAVEDEYAIATTSLLGAGHKCVYSDTPKGEPVIDMEGAEYTAVPLIDAEQDSGLYEEFHIVTYSAYNRYPCTVAGCTDFIVKAETWERKERHQIGDNVCVKCSIAWQEDWENESPIDEEPWMKRDCEHIEKLKESGELEGLIKWEPVYPDGGDWDPYADEAKKGNYRYVKKLGTYECNEPDCYGTYTEYRDFFIAELVTEKNDTTDDDDMPKTGETGMRNSTWAMLTALCFAGYLTARKQRGMNK